MPECQMLEIFYDYVCPWCYFITGCIEKLHREFQIDIRWTAFQLHPETSEEGQTLDALFADKNVDFGKNMALQKRVASRLGLPFGDCRTIYNSRLAQEVGKLAESKGKGHDFHKALFRSYFVEGKNIGKTRVLVEVAESINLNGSETKKIIQQRTYQEATDLDCKRSLASNITVVPTFLLNNQILVGAQQYETLENFLISNNVKRRKPKRIFLRMESSRTTAFQPVENGPSPYGKVTQQFG
jgi:predicted DsbA family dithiol-disulfide isomerase